MSTCQHNLNETVSPPVDAGPDPPLDSGSEERTLTLGDSDISLLRLVGVLPSYIHNVEALELLLDRSKTAHVAVHVVDTGGNLVHRVELANENGLPPTVNDLRESLNDHFQTVADGYKDDVSKAVAVGVLGGLLTAGDDWIVPLGDGVSLTSMSVERQGFQFVPEFNADVSWGFPRNFCLCVNCEHQIIYCFRDDASNSEVAFFQFLEVVAKKVRETSGLECILGPEIFPQRPLFVHGTVDVSIPTWKLSFATESAKSTFLDLCDALPRVCRLADSARISKEKCFQAGGSFRMGAFRLDETLAKIAHRSTLLQRLSNPVRAAFEKNDHWWMCARTGRFGLAAAESEDPEKSRKLEGADSLVDLIGTAEARPDDENAAPNTIQLRIVEPMV